MSRTIKLTVAGVPITLITFEKDDGKRYWLFWSLNGFSGRVEKTRLGNYWVVDCKEEYFDGFTRKKARY